MYSDVVGIQILISLMKKHGIDTIVISAGQSNSSFARSVEHDSFFQCFSVVDERSAAFFAVGLALELKKPVAISCTASTACCNYLSAITEAFYRGIPILILTSNYDIRRVDQMKLLAIHQEDIFRDVTKYEVQLPDVHDRRSFEYCQRLVNEAILELDHHGRGPVHIDVPSYDTRLKENCVQLPETRAIQRINQNASFLSFAKKLYASNTLVICGQDYYDVDTIDQLEKLYNNYGCVICGEHYSNIKRDFYININPLISNYSKEIFSQFKPDLIITIGKHVQFDWYYFENLGIEHWHCNEDGSITDHFNSLTYVFEFTKCSFLKKLNECFVGVKQKKKDKNYFEIIRSKAQGITIPELPLSHVYCIQEFCKVIPDNSILHNSVFNSIRLTQYFDLPNNVKCYANYGALGIDGCMSTFLGQAAAFRGLCFLIIGDLSFFYDMNSLMIRHNKNNIRILLLNNHGGAEFYQNNGWYDTIDLHTAAAHNVSPKGWAEDAGFLYLSAKSKGEYCEQLKSFVADADRPILFEVFNDIKEDEAALKKLKSVNYHGVQQNQVKEAIKKVVGKKGVAAIKSIIKK